MFTCSDTVLNFLQYVLESPRSILVWVLLFYCFVTGCLVFIRAWGWVCGHFILTSQILRAGLHYGSWLFTLIMQVDMLLINAFLENGLWVLTWPEWSLFITCKCFPLTYEHACCSWICSALLIREEVGGSANCHILIPFQINVIWKQVCNMACTRYF